MVQKSFKGMLLELLYQLLLHNPSLFDRVEGTYERLVTVQRTLKPEWDLESLKSSLLDALTKDGRRLVKSQLIFFIDALDENQNSNDNREIVSFLQELAEQVLSSNTDATSEDITTGHQVSGVKICIASRDWLVFQNALGNHPRIPSFAMDKFTTGDIRLYAQEMLGKAASGDSSSPESQASQDFSRFLENMVEQITAKAHGVFIWVRIVVQEVGQLIESGSSMSMIEDELSEFPEEIQDLYEWTMRRISPRFGVESLVACRILLASMQPLTLEALHCATRAAITGGYEDTNRIRQIQWLKSRTGGLIEEIDESPHLRNSRYPKLQFIHQTAQEFVRRGMPGVIAEEIVPDVTKADGNFLIYVAIAASHPPYPPLLATLAPYMFDYLRALDQSVFDGGVYDRLKDPNREFLLRYHRNGLFRGDTLLWPGWHSGTMTLSSTCPVDVSQVQYYCESFETGEFKLWLLKLLSHLQIEDWRVIALILQDVTYIFTYTIFDGLSREAADDILHLAALGPRVTPCTTVRRTQMTRYLLEGSRVKLMYQPRADFSLPERLMICINHPSLEDVDLLLLAHLMLAYSPPPADFLVSMKVVPVRVGVNFDRESPFSRRGKATLFLDDPYATVLGYELPTISTSYTSEEPGYQFSVPVLEICALLTDERWVALLGGYFDIDSLIKSKYTRWRLKLALVLRMRNAISIRGWRECIYQQLEDQSTDDYRVHWLEESRTSGICSIIGGMALGSVACPGIYRAGFEPSLGPGLKPIPGDLPS
jgi:hypothetical protein